MMNIVNRVPHTETEQERAHSRIINEWELLQNERAKVHQEALRLSQKRELAELEKQEIIESKVREEMKRIKELEKSQRRLKETVHKNSDKTDEEILDSDSSNESVEGEGHKKVKKAPELTDAAKKIATRTLRD